MTLSEYQVEFVGIPQLHTYLICRLIPRRYLGWDFPPHQFGKGTSAFTFERLLSQGCILVHFEIKSLQAARPCIMVGSYNIQGFDPLSGLSGRIERLCRYLGTNVENISYNYIR